VTVTVNANPTVTAYSSPATICAGASSTLTAGGATTYSWNNNLGTGNPKIVNPAVTTTYGVTGTSSNGCSKATTVTVTVNTLPSVVMTVSPSAICQGASSTLTASGASSYAWSNSLGTGSSKTVTPTITTTYTVTGTSSTTGCSKAATGTVTVNPKPTVTVTANPSTISHGQASTLTAGGASTYSWSNSLGTGNPKVVTPITTTNYTVTGTSAFSCTNSAKVTVTVTSKSYVQGSGTSADENEQISQPAVRCYPNPFSQKANILFILPEDNHVKIDVYDIGGNKILTLFDADVSKDREYIVEFDGKELASGLYFYRLTTNTDAFSGRMLLNKE
jgi:hypothetical protein